LNPDKIQIIASLEKQLDHSPEKLWRVFSWCSSILICITGAVLLAACTDKIKLLSQDHFLIWIVVMTLTLYAYLWIKENLFFEGTFRDELDTIFETELNYPQLEQLCPDKVTFGYSAVILLLGFVALAATWLSYMQIIET
jgi:hypothetical protein